MHYTTIPFLCQFNSQNKTGATRTHCGGCSWTYWNFRLKLCGHYLPAATSCNKYTDLTRRRGRLAQSLINMHSRRIIYPGSVLIQMTSSTWTWLINTPQLSVPCRRRQADTDTTLTLASSDRVQMPNRRRHHLLVQGLGSGHYWTRSLVPSTYSTTVLLISEHRHKRSPLTLIRAQRTFGCPKTAAIAMVINSMRPIVQLSARLIKISPLPMWGHFKFHSTLDRFPNLTSHLPSPHLFFSFLICLGYRNPGRPGWKGNRQSLGQSRDGCRFDRRVDNQKSSIRIREQPIQWVWQAAERRSHRRGVWDHRSIPPTDLLRELNQGAQDRRPALLRTPLASRGEGLFRG